MLRGDVDYEKKRSRRQAPACAGPHRGSHAAESVEAVRLKVRVKQESKVLWRGSVLLGWGLALPGLCRGTQRPAETL